MSEIVLCRQVTRLLPDGNREPFGYVSAIGVPMPKNRMLILVVAIAVSSTFAQDQTPSTSEKHQIVVETNLYAVASVLKN